MRWIAFASALWVAGIACQRKPTPACNPPCINSGVCVAGVCQCPLPFEGSDCSQDAREKFVGTWEGLRQCGDVRGGMRYFAWKDSLTDQVFLAGSFVAAYQDTLAGRLVEPYRMRLSQQLLRDTALAVEGWAEQRWDSLLLQLAVTAGTSQRDTCFWTLKRR
ncbi:MAG: hypothetical protein N3A68_06440 [Bacteroidia bacterium]|nr:hypothetical protein [Bacteroidia bacterium]GIV23015.1 MAG: hypothetical protein KatS3mg025_0674 [Bacteroidia bacterium]